MEVGLYCGWGQPCAAVVETRLQADVQRYKLLVLILIFGPPVRKKNDFPVAKR